MCNTDVITLKPFKDINCLLMLGILNSKVCSKYIKSKNVNLDREAFPKINTKTLESFPLPRDLHNSVAIQISKLVESLLNLNFQKKETTLPEKIEQLNQRIAYTDEKVNKLVCELYGLSEEEIRIVEGGKIR